MVEKESLKMAFESEKDNKIMNAIKQLKLMIEGQNSGGFFAARKN